jgi:glycosyltransferase involved in cell wall biosynthesis
MGRRWASAERTWQGSSSGLGAPHALAASTPSDYLASMRIAMLMHTNTPWAPLYARWFLARGDEVLVVSFHPDRLAGVPSVFLGVEPFDKYRNKHVYLTRLPRVRRVLRGFAPDLVFAPYILSNGLMAALASPVPFVTSARGGDVLDHPDHPWWRRRAKQAVMRGVCARARLVHSVASELSDALRRAGVPSAKIVEFPVGVDRSRFHPPAPGSPRPAVPRIVCTRNHMPVYDIPTILDALARLGARGRDFRAEFAGGGDLLEAHRRRVTDLGLGRRVELLGPRPHDELPETLRRAGVYVTAALSDGTSASLLEALATGLVPVVPDIPANRGWLVHGESGLLFPPGDAAALADALERALTDTALRKRACEAGPRTVAERADLEANMLRLAALFDAACGTRALAQFGT